MTEVTGVTPGEISIRNIYTRQTGTLSADSCVASYGGVADDGLLDQLCEHRANVVGVGDCISPRDILGAISDGMRAMDKLRVAVGHEDEHATHRLAVVEMTTGDPCPPALKSWGRLADWPLAWLRAGGCICCPAGCAAVRADAHQYADRAFKSHGHRRGDGRGAKVEAAWQAVQPRAQQRYCSKNASPPCRCSRQAVRMDSELVVGCTLRRPRRKSTDGTRVPFREGVRPAGMGRRSSRGDHCRTRGVFGSVPQWAGP